MGYRINGHDCTEENGLLPQSHQITPEGTQQKKTIGGVVTTQATGGQGRSHIWHYDTGRKTGTVGLLRQYLDLESSPIVIIDTYDVIKAADGTYPLLTGLVCTVDFPDIKTANQRGLTEAFSLTFTEISPQS